MTREWLRTGKGLRGKIHVIVGDADTFHLDESARLLEGELRSSTRVRPSPTFPGRPTSISMPKGPMGGVDQEDCGRDVHDRSPVEIAIRQTPSPVTYPVTPRA